MNAIRISKELMDQFAQKKSNRYVVHSIFKEAINLMDDSGELITLLTENKDLAPMSIVIFGRSAYFRNILANDEVEVTNSGMRFIHSQIELDFSSAVVTPCILMLEGKALDSENQIIKMNQMRNILCDRGESSGILPLLNTVERYKGISIDSSNLRMNTYCEFIQGVFTEIIKNLDQKNFEGVVSWLPKFIGFGPGLTPSTDDFLTGAILTLIASAAMGEDSTEAVEELAQNIYSFSVGRTTKVSETMLKQAALGRASENHLKVVQSLFISNNLNFEFLVKRVLANGATSGADFLLGVYCAMVLSKY
ncbi:MAG: DUF2877 domain-containing protein [Clostridia bacterium]|nr:DUF2877 domain-containing protein [Clostridia bacterium]